MPEDVVVRSLLLSLLSLGALIWKRWGGERMDCLPELEKLEGAEGIVARAIEQEK